MKRLFGREGTLWKRNFKAHFNQKNTIVKKYFRYLQVLCAFVCRDKREVECRGQRRHAGGSWAEQGRLRALISKQLRY